jgi:hypothetical protein
MDLDYCQLVRDSISGERAVDDQTLAALEVLKDRLERLKKLGSGFAGVGFSPAVLKLAEQKKLLAV